MCYYISEYIIVNRMKFLNNFFQCMKTFCFIRDFCKIKVARYLCETQTLKNIDKASCYAYCIRQSRMYMKHIRRGKQKQRKCCKEPANKQTTIYLQ